MVRKILFGVAAMFAVSVLSTGTAFAQAKPTATATGGDCTNLGARNPVVWKLSNNEVSSTRENATVSALISPNTFSSTELSPSSLPNNGKSFATATTNVPADYDGKVYFSYVIRWGPGEFYGGSLEVTVHPCRPTTTTSTLPKTGPKEDIIRLEIVGVVILVFLGIALLIVFSTPSPPKN